MFGASQAISTALLADEFVPSNLPIDLITTWLVALLGTEMSSAGTCLEFHSSRCHRRRAEEQTDYREGDQEDHLPIESAPGRQHRLCDVLYRFRQEQADSR